MRPQQKTLNTEPIPYAAVPPRAFCSITFKSSEHDSLTDDDFFSIRDELLTFLLPYQIKTVFPFGFTKDNNEVLMICFECSPSIEESVFNFIYTSKQYDKQYRVTFNFDPLA